MRAIIAIVVIVIVTLISNSAYGQTVAGDVNPSKVPVVYAADTEKGQEVTVSRSGDYYHFSDNVKKIQIFFNGKSAHMINVTDGKVSLNWDKAFSFQCFDERGNKIFIADKKFHPIK